MNQTAIILLGRSGCGKGTQGSLLSSYLEKKSDKKVLYVQSGSELRKFIKGAGISERLARDIYDQGNLEPEFLMIYMWANFIVNNYTGGEHMIVDGTPRKPHEASALHSMFRFYGIEKPFAIYINVKKEEAIERLLRRGRTDDAREEIAERQSWFETDVVPTIEYYRHNPHYNFIEILGDGTPEQVHQRIVDTMLKLVV